MFGAFKITYESEHETLVDKLARHRRDIASKIDSEYFDEEIETITELVEALGKLNEGNQVNDKILEGFNEARQAQADKKARRNAVRMDGSKKTDISEE